MMGGSAVTVSARPMANGAVGFVDFPPPVEVRRWRRGWEAAANAGQPNECEEKPEDKTLGFHLGEIFPSLMAKVTSAKPAMAALCVTTTTVFCRFLASSPSNATMA